MTFLQQALQGESGLRLLYLVANMASKFRNNPPD
jgi:hypothetical protein